MNLKIIFLLITLTCSIFVNSEISLSHLNNELKKNYSFVERSLNQTDLEINNSSGEIFFDKDGISVKILSPFEEIYRIEDNTLQIYDVFLDQTQIIDLKIIDNLFLNILVKGVDENSDQYQVKFLDSSSIEIFPKEANKPIKFLFLKEKLKRIHFIDSIGIEHGIELNEI